MAAKTKTVSTNKQISRLNHRIKKIKLVARTSSVSKNTIKRYLQQSSGNDFDDVLALKDVILEGIFSSHNKAQEADRCIHFM